MRRLDPVMCGIALLGFSAGYCRWWLDRLVATYGVWPWWRQAIVRLAIIAASAGIAALVIAWWVSLSPRRQAGPYWFFWCGGLVTGLIIEEFRQLLDRILP